MSKVLTFTSLVLLAFCLLAPGLQAQKPKKKRTKPETYSVISVDKELQVVSASSLKELKKRIEAEHKEATKAWFEARKSAKKAKEKFTDPQPKKPQVKVKKSGFRSKSEADFYLAELQKRNAKKSTKSSKSSKPSGKKGGGGD